MVELTRRACLLSLLSLAACRRRKRMRMVKRDAARPVEAGAAGAADREPEGVELVEWTLPAPIHRVAVLRPRQSGRFAAVIALHGHGEAVKGPDAGAMGWPRDYELMRAWERMASPPLTEDDFEGLVEPAHLAEMNDGLKEKPYTPLVAVCPYVPDVHLDSAAEVQAYRRAVVEELLPRMKAESFILGTPESTGIDGVSLGGALALRVGLAAPDAFGAVGALQPALYEWNVPEMTELVRAARTQRPALALRLTTSERDPFRRAVTKTSEAWQAAGIAHDFAVLPGPHDYIFNRGPGALELLFWHDRHLRH